MSQKMIGHTLLLGLLTSCVLAVAQCYHNEEQKRLAEASKKALEGA